MLALSMSQRLVSWFIPGTINHSFIQQDLDISNLFGGVNSVLQANSLYPT